MSDWPLSDPMGSIVSELRTAGLASGRIRGGEAAPGDAMKPYQAFAVITDLGGPRMHRVPLQTLRYSIRAYGATYQAARALYAEISDELDNGGPRYGATGVAIHQSLDDTGGEAGKDPLTGQPFYEGVFEIFAGAQLVAS